MKKKAISLSLLFIVIVLSVILVIFNTRTISDNSDIYYEHNIQEIPDLFIEGLRLNQINEILDISSPVLIYRYTTDVCSSCLHEDLYELSKYMDNLGKQNVMILPAYPNSRYSRIRLSNELAKFNYRNISIDSVAIPFDEDGVTKRYFALISGNGEPEMVFFPEIGKTELTKLFLKRVQLKFKNNNDYRR